MKFTKMCLKKAMKLEPKKFLGQFSHFMRSFCHHLPERNSGGPSKLENESFDEMKKLNFDLLEVYEPWI